MSKPPGSRLSRLDIVCTKCRVPRFEPVQDQEVYTLVLPSYLVAGGDGYSMIAEEMWKHNSGEEEQKNREREKNAGEVREGDNSTSSSSISSSQASSALPAGDLDVSVVANYISQKQWVFPAVEGRIKIISSAPGLQRLSAALVPLVPLLLLLLRT